MSTVFLAGSISIRQLHEKMQARIASVVSRDHNIVIGDAEGADTAIQPLPATASRPQSHGVL